MIKYIKQENGPTIGYSTDSKVNILEVDGLKFKDLNNNGVLDPYEDYRLPYEERAKDLAARLSKEEIGGLMLYSAHQAVSSADDVFSMMFQGHYDGKKFSESDAVISDLSDEQKNFLINDYVRHVLVTTVDSPEVAATWSNNLQSFTEGIGHGIPVNISTDPRHAPIPFTEFNAGAGGDISKWPEPLGLAATFDPEVAREFGEVGAREYRAMGMTTALSPQIDLATDPRWMRFSGTFGEDTKLSTDMGKAYIDGFQTTNNGWGSESVNAMVKHWPGGGSGEAGRDAHYEIGKYAVYPGDNFDEHLIPFTEGAFKLDGGTNKAAAVMPYYTISYEQDPVNGENVGNSYSHYIINDLLREKYGYEGVVCTDWMITQDNEKVDSFVTGKNWGVDHLSVGERHYKVLKAGVDQFGGNNELAPVLEAYEMGVKEFGEEAMKARFNRSAERLLMNIFNTGLFENPYLETEGINDVVGGAEAMEKGYEAQLKSIVMLKNKDNTLPLNKTKVYIPERIIGESQDWFGNKVPAHNKFPTSKEIVDKFYDLVDNPEDAEAAIIFIDSPQTFGYTNEEGYLPLSLQYRPYTAEYAREKSIAGDRSYKGKTNYTSNEKDLDIILETREKMPNKPIVVVLTSVNPTVVEEFEPYVDAILVQFNVQHQSVLDIIKGNYNPSGLLPFQMPKNMEVVEKQMEDVAHDMEVYVDSENNAYDFAYGLNFSGVIEDERTAKYKHSK